MGCQCNKDSPPEYAPIGDGQLLYLSNSESDLLKEVASQDFYVLLSRRWFASRTLDGPWAFVPADAMHASSTAQRPCA